MTRKSIALWMVFGLIASVSASWAQEKVLERTVSERLIVKIAPSAIPESLKVSPDGQRVAYVAQSGSKWSVVVDGKEGKAYDGIGKGTLVFSPDGQHVAYAAQSGNKRVVVVDGKEGKAYDGLLKGSRVVFDSADSLHYLAVKDGGNSVYLVEEKLK